MDLAEQVWAEVGRELGQDEAEAMTTASVLVLVGSAEIIASRRSAEFAAVAAALMPDDPARGGNPVPEQAVAAFGYLMHANLSDDAYRLAHHPGMTVLPACTAGAVAVAADGTTTLRMIATGYELSCRLADLFLPEASSRGWRMSALVAPMTAAALYTAFHDPSLVPAALRLAASLAGGPLQSVNGADWRLQPALLGASGILAARAVLGGASGNAGALESALGPVSLTTGLAPPSDFARRSRGDGRRLREIMWKRYDVAMYGQAIFDAVRKAGPELAGHPYVTVTVPAFAARYADQATLPVSSVASIEGIVVKALARFAGKEVAESTQIRVQSSPDLDELEARVEASSTSGHVVSVRGSGSTRGCGVETAADHVKHRLGAGADDLVAVVTDLPSSSSSDTLTRAWRSL